MVTQGIETSSDTTISLQYCSRENEDDISAVVLNVYNEMSEELGTLVENTVSLTVLNAPMEIASVNASLGSWNSSFPPSSWDSRLEITAYARRYVYNVNGYTCYRPQSCSATCTYSERPQYFSAEYICDGFMVDLDTGVLGDEDIHSILVSKSSPVSGQSYSKNSAYASGVGLYTFSGSPSVGEFITFAYRYSGEDRQEYTVHT